MLNKCKSLINSINPTGYGVNDYYIIKIRDLCRVVDNNFPYGWKPRNYKDEYLKHILEIDTIDNINELYYERLCNSYCVRLRNVENIENIPLLMIGFHSIYKNTKTLINPPHGFTNIETLYGKIPIDL